MLHIREVPAFLQVRMVDRLSDGEEGGRGTAVGLTEVHDLLLGVFQGPLLDQRVDHVGVLGSNEHVLKHLRLCPIRISHRSTQAVPLARLQGHHPHIAVLARDDGGRCTERHADACARLEHSVLSVPADVLAADKQCGENLRAGDIDVLAAACLFASIYRR